MLIDERTKALFELGWIKPIDGLFLFLLVMGTLTLIGFVVFGLLLGSTATVWQIFGTLMFLVMDLQVWALLIGYRVCLMLLEARSEIHTLPEQAANILIGKAKANAQA